MAAAITKSQIAKAWPNILIPPLVFEDENSTKYPTTIQNVAGMKLIKKHMATTSLGGKASGL